MTIDENVAVGTVVYTAPTVTDPEGGTLFYSVIGTDADYFNVSNLGTVTFKTRPNYEAKPSPAYQFRVLVTDSGGLADETSIVTVTLNNLNEQAVFAVSGNSTGALFARKTSDDPEGNGTFTYHWQKSTDGVTNWQDISGAQNSETYTPVSGDGHVRLAQVTYIDAGGVSETIAFTNATFKTEDHTYNQLQGQTQGNAGRDYMAGSAGDDVLNGLAGDDIIHGGTGNDSIIGGDGSDRLDGGVGIDTLFYVDDTQGVSVNLATGVALGGDAEGDSFSGFENVVGGSGDDVLVGDAGANLLEGYIGQDTLDGGGGIDTLSYQYATAGVTIDLSQAAGSDGYRLVDVAANSDGDILNHAAGDRFKNFENLLGSYGDDTLSGDAQANMLDGGSGSDRLTGGAGNDIFVLELRDFFRAKDVVTDFATGANRLRVDVSDPSTISGADDQLATLQSTAQIRWTRDSDDNGDGKNDTIIYHTAGTVVTRDDTIVMVLDDYTAALDFADFEIV